MNFTFRILLSNYSKGYDYTCSIIFFISLPFLVIYSFYRDIVWDPVRVSVLWELIEFYLIQVERNLQSIINLQVSGLCARCISISALVKQLGLVSRIRDITEEKCMHSKKCIHATCLVEFFHLLSQLSRLTIVSPQSFELRFYWLSL